MQLLLAVSPKLPTATVLDLAFTKLRDRSAEVRKVAFSIVSSFCVHESLADSEDNPDRVGLLVAHAHTLSSSDGLSFVSEHMWRFVTQDAGNPAAALRKLSVAMCLPMYESLLRE